MPVASPGRTVRMLFILLLVSASVRAQFQYDNAHSGSVNSAEIEDSVEVLWRTRAAGAVRSTAAIVGDRLIIGSSDGTVSCVRHKDGVMLWKFSADASVSSSPVVKENVAYIVSRKNTLYALRVTDGSVVWKKSLGASLSYEWGFDYYVGSVSIDGTTLFAGSGDGTLYAIDLGTQNITWRFRAGSMIRSTPAIDSENVYIGDCSGKVYAIRKTSGRLVWRFLTVGDTLVNERFGFDRKAVIASPTLYQDLLLIGSRDGWLYALERRTGRVRWKYDHEVSWVISTSAVSDDILVTGTSDGCYVHALSVKDGKELWRFATRGPVWASPSIAGKERVIAASNDGYVYCLALRTGEEAWRQKIGPQIFSSPVLLGNEVFVGSDDGSVTALRTQEAMRKPARAIRRAVFWMKDPPVQTFRAGMDLAVREYFIGEGYELYDQTDIADFLLSRLKSDTASVVVFATNFFPQSITRDTLGSNLLRTYLASGGKVVILGLNPSVYKIDPATKRVTGLDYSQSERTTGISYRYPDLRSHGGFYSSFPTTEGRSWGLEHAFVAFGGMPVSDVTVPLALDENGRATAWVKEFMRRRGTGFVQLVLTPERLSELPEVERVAEYGLR